MTEHVARRIPRAGLDPITDCVTALDVVSCCVHLPPRHETIIVLLDRWRCGSTITVVAGTCRPDDVVEAVECVARAATDGTISGMVVASVRPGGDVPDAGDVDRWLEMSDIGDRLGLPLVEWFVIGARTVCPRDLLGEPPRW